jgi:hypothetical protein
MGAKELSETGNPVEILLVIWFLALGMMFFRSFRKGITREQRNVEIRTALVLAVVSLLFVLATSAFAGQFKVTRVYDGDTVKAEGHDVENKVRLMGVDAPEISRKKGEPSQPYAQKAKGHLTKLVHGKVVDVKGYGTDRYGRVMGMIYLDGKNINPRFEITVEKPFRHVTKGAWFGQYTACNHPVFCTNSI